MTEEDDEERALHFFPAALHNLCFCCSKALHLQFSVIYSKQKLFNSQREKPCFFKQKSAGKCLLYFESVSAVLHVCHALTLSTVILLIYVYTRTVKDAVILLIYMHILYCKSAVNNCELFSFYVLFITDHFILPLNLLFLFLLEVTKLFFSLSVRNHERLTVCEQSVRQSVTNKAKLLCLH